MTICRRLFCAAAIWAVTSSVTPHAQTAKTPILRDAQPASDDLWPTKGWATASPSSVGLDEAVLLKLDKDMALGKLSQMMDSFAVFRCGKKVFERTYPHDYAALYDKEAGESGPYNERLTGRYNYFDPYWHPYDHGTDLHSMQSVSKTVNR